MDYLILQCRRFFPFSNSLTGLIMSPAKLRRQSKSGKSILGKIDRTLGFNLTFSSTFDLGKEIGKGHFGSCFMAKLRSGFKNTQKEYAVKVISREKITSTTHRNNLLQEVQLLKGLSGSEYTVKFYEAYEDDKNVYIVMELCEGGQLLERMPKWTGRIAEDDVKDIIKKLLNAISYLHLQGVIHRDLKPENLLFATKAKQSSIKIVDFGLSEYVTLDQPLHDIVGTPHYIAPEMLNQSYNIEADCWSLGVIIYYLLSGKHPFEGRTDEAIFKSVKNDDPVFSIVAHHGHLFPQMLLIL